MAKREKFGKFVLLEDIETSSLGVEHRAAKLGPGGFEKIVNILRLRPALSANAEVAKNLMDQVKVAAQLQNPNVIRIYGIGKVDAVYYVSYEFVEGKSLRAIFERCRRDTFPFSVDHALLIASKVCSALEYSHGRKSEGGGRYYHGLLNTGNVIVSYEGEIRVRGFGHWLAGVRDAGGLRDEDALYLSPEQAAGGMGDTRSDIFAVGALLFEALTGGPLFEGGREGDIAGRLAKARLQNPPGDDDTVPKAIADILARSLAQDPSARYAEIQELRKGIDTLLFSGDFSPTTFNLAFFMHSIFRDDIDRESKEIKDEREASYAEFLTEGAPKPTGNTITLNTTPIPAPAAAPSRAEPAPTVVLREPPAPPREIHATPPHAAPSPEPLAGSSGVSAKEAAASFTFHKETPPKSKTPLIAAALLVIVVAGGAAYYFFAGRLGGTPAPSAPPTTTLSSEAVSALARVKELEDKLKAIEEEKAAAEQKAKDDATAKLQKEAKAKGTEVDASALQRAQDEAAKKARADQERKAQEEKKKLEDAKAAEEQRVAEEQKKAEEQRRADEAARAAASATTTLSPTTTLPAVHAGALVNVNDPGVIAPVPEKAPPVQYPQIALRQRVEGVVELNVLVDEKGAVTDAQIVTGVGGRSGLDEAALENVKRRHYRPATKDGVAVKTWIPVRVQFKLPS
jgi:TonB family protein